MRHGKSSLAEQSQKTFKDWAQHYDHDHWSWYFDYCYKSVQSLISGNIQPGSNVLDIGCGTGILADRLSPLITVGKIVGIDPVSEMVAIAKKRNKNNPNVEIINISIEAFQPIEKFDLIFCLNVFHHIENQKKIINKIHSLLTNDGIFVYLDPFRDNFFRLSWEYISKYLFFREPYIKYYKKRDLFQLFEEAGYDIYNVKVILYVILVCVLKKKDGQS